MIIKNGQVVFPDRIQKIDIEIKDGIITNISEDLKGDEIVDVEGRYVVAGYIDIHTHGGYGSDFMDADLEAFNNVTRFHLDNGTTSVLATSVTAPIKSIENFIKFYKEYKQGKQEFARVLGIHLEGPYLSVKNKGAQKEEYLLTPSKNSYDWILNNSDLIRTVTISPELDGASKMTKDLVNAGIKVCGGHDDGIFPEFVPAINNGLSHLTHAFCAMSEVRFKDGKRNIGLREYGLINDDLTMEMIADNKHLPPELVKLIVKCKTSDKVCVVSDSLRCAGMPNDGRLYKLGTKNDSDAQLFKVSDGVAVLADGSKLAGSITPVSKAVQNVYKAGFSVIDAIKMGNYNPARFIKEDKLGEIKIGNIADICILDKDLNVKQVILNGKLR